MVLRIAKWAGVRKEGSDLKIENVLHNWEACLKMGAMMHGYFKMGQHILSSIGALHHLES